MLMLRKIKDMLDSGMALEEVSLELDLPMDWLEMVVGASGFQLL